MHEEFHKALRNLSLFGGLLLDWALIGIELGEVPFSNLIISLTNPVPTV